MFNENEDERRRRRRALIRGLLATLPVLLAAGCSRWDPWPRRSAAVPERESELHALAIAPDVEYARTLDLGNGRRLHGSDRDLFYVENDQFYPIVVRGYPHLVGVSPGRRSVAFLEPFEFETAANLYVFDLATRTLRRLTDHSDEGSTLSVRAVHWYDERTLYYLQGYRFGTVSHGGDLWRVDIVSTRREPVIQLVPNSENYEEIVEFEFVPGHKLIRYVVAHYDQYGQEIRQPHYCTLDGTPVR